MIKLNLVQFSPVIGDIKGNLARIKEFITDSCGELIIFPELSLTGYMICDLAMNPAFIKDAADAFFDLLEFSKNINAGIIIGNIELLPNGSLTNACYLIENGQILSKNYKNQLPNYGVFDEKRIFTSFNHKEVVDFRNLKLGILICEDLWFKDDASFLKEQGAEVLICVNASPFAKGKHKQRQKIAHARFDETNLPIIYVNNIGGQDSVVFDGGSFIYNNGVTLQLPFFEEVNYLCNLKDQSSVIEELNENAQIYNASMLALRDYARNNNFSKIIIGLSGGMDSCITAVIAADAIGPENVWCIMLPYLFTSPKTISDATAFAKNLKVKFDILPIKEGIDGLTSSLAPLIDFSEIDVTFENLQSRTRAIMLMALSNKYGHLLVTTGNKSEMAVGYATLYGDMCGGYNPIKDIYKTEVYAIAKFRNQQKPKGALGVDGMVISDEIIHKPPSAELRPDQKDSDSLPDYEILDAILYQLIEENKSVAEISNNGFDQKIVEKINRLLYLAEYKRMQAPIGAKISSKSFGLDRRYPITNKWIYK